VLEPMAEESGARSVGLDSLSQELLCSVWSYTASHPTANLTRIDQAEVTVFDIKGLLGRLCPVSPAISRLLYSSLENFVVDFHGLGSRRSSFESIAFTSTNLMRSAARCEALSSLQVGNLQLEDHHLTVLGERLAQLQHLGCFNAALRAPNLSTCGRLRTLNLRQCSALVAIDLSACLSLTSLDLSFTPIGDKDLRTMLPLPFRRQIRHLLVKHCKNVSFGTLPGEGHDDGSSLLSGWSGLRMLNVGHTHTTADTLFALTSPENTPSLERLEAAGQTRHAKDLRLGYRTSAVFTSVALQSNGSIRHLVLTRCERLSTLRLIGARNIETLDLSKTCLSVCRLLSCLLDAPEGAPQLRRLVMQEAREINIPSEVDLQPYSISLGGAEDGALQASREYEESRKLAQLEVLDLSASACRSSLLAEAVAAAPRLRRLDIKGCLFSDDTDGRQWPIDGSGRAVVELAAIAGHGLEEVDASSNSMALPSAALSGVLVASMLGACPKLTKFSMAWNHCFTGDIGMEDLCAPCLMYLNLDNSGVQSGHLQHLVRRCPKLRRLTAKSCISLVSTLDLSHGTLQELSLAHCVNLPGLQLDLPFLRVLDLTECASLTADQCTMEARAGIQPPRLIISAVDVNRDAKQVFLSSEQG